MTFEEGARPSVSAKTFAPQIINLMRVPGVRQVMLKVQIAELNRTALRQIGTDMIARFGNNTIATFVQNAATGNTKDLLGAASSGTIVGIFGSDFSIVLRALRQNNLATILAEPNLVTMDGHVAQFQSGGEFPVPVAQFGGGGNNTVEFKPFGVQLAFIPYIQDDGVIRLHVEPEVSTVDEDLGVSLVTDGGPVPGVRTRNTSTTVELREGQTLAIAGLLNREVDGSTARIPLLGDVPYIAPLFGANRHQVIEQELLVMVTPYLVSPREAEQCMPLPGMEVMEPNDLEFYLLSRIAGRTGRPHRSTTQWDNPFHPSDYCVQMDAEQTYMLGPVGLSE
jgi:pilus assembly protein CpaC